MKKVLYSMSEVREMINDGKKLALAGDEKILASLPAGDWIGGTIPYFMAEEGGIFTKDKIFVTELPAEITSTVIKIYDETTIPQIYLDAPPNSFSLIIIPATSPLHLSFALNAPTYEGFVTSPLIGWISGVDLNDLGKITPKVFAGNRNQPLENEAVVMHATLPDDKYADINIVNIFTQGQGDNITFKEDGFKAKTAIINGTEVNFADYIKDNELDTRLPLVANYCGAMINTSFQGVDEENNEVNFYAPVFKDNEYYLAAPIENYVKSFVEQMPNNKQEEIIFSCNCILNYLYSELEGKKTGDITGPITFGEIAYQLLNQTMTYLIVADR